jgi:kynurenine formamidase
MQPRREPVRESTKEQTMDLGILRPARALALLALAAGVGIGAVQAQQPAPRCLTASKFGPNDEIGNLNHVTPAKTLAATKLVTRGKAYRLGIETNSRTPAFAPRTFSLTIVQPGQAAGATLGPTKTTYNDDIIAGWVGIGSQLDGLGHIGIDNLYFNCNKAADFAATDGLKKLGIEKVPPIATRGVLLDMAGYFRTDIVKEGTAFNRAEIEGAMKRQGIAAIEKGDVVLFYTGWTKLIGKDNTRYATVEPGLGVEGAMYLAALEVAMVGADTWGLEVIPFEKDAGVFEVHQTLLPLHGIHILENIDTAEMVKDQAWEFLFTLGPSRITGAVQAIVNPIAIK